MNYYYVNNFDIEAENEEEAIEKAEERKVLKREGISCHFLGDDETDRELFFIKYWEYEEVKVKCYMKYKNMNIDIRNIAIRGSKYIDFTGREDENKIVFNEFEIDSSDDVKKYIGNYFKENYPDKDYYERYTDYYSWWMKFTERLIREKKNDKIQ
jgi:hypothetical protein